MSTGMVVALVAVIVVVAAVAFAVSRPLMRRGRLEKRFGPEYERALTRHDGDAKAAEKDLENRLRLHADLRPLPLSAEAREQYAARWAGTQEGFVDAPVKALADADRLLSLLLRDRGYPADGQERADALSVHHPRAVQGYREARAVVRRAENGHASTEELRAAVVSARELFAELVRSGPADTVHHAGASGRGSHGARGARGTRDAEHRPAFLSRPARGRHA